MSSYNPKFYPGFLFFNNGYLSWVKVSQLTADEMASAYDIAFNSSITKDDLKDAEGNSVFSHKRTKDDVRNDLSERTVPCWRNWTMTAGP